MTVTPETIARHELIGLPVRIIDAKNTDLVGIEGRVVRETTGTLVVRAGDDPLGDVGAPRKQVPKAGTTFAFELETGVRIRVDGNRLVARPARRTETSGRSAWV